MIFLRLKSCKNITYPPKTWNNGGKASFYRKRDSLGEK